MYRTDWRETIDKQRGIKRPLDNSVKNDPIKAASDLVSNLTNQRNSRKTNLVYDAGESFTEFVKEVSRVKPGFAKALKVIGLIDGNGKLSGGFLSSLGGKAVPQIGPKELNKMIGDFAKMSLTGGMPPEFAGVIEVGIKLGFDGLQNASKQTGDIRNQSFGKKFGENKKALSKVGFSPPKNAAPEIEQQIAVSELIQDPDGKEQGPDIFAILNGAGQGYSFVEMLSQERAARGRSNIQFNKAPAGRFF